MFRGAVSIGVLHALTSEESNFETVACAFEADPAAEVCSEPSSESSRPGSMVDLWGGREGGEGSTEEG